jgi:hypothetical protein
VRPRDIAALGTIAGIGRAKLERYGDALLGVVHEQREPAQRGGPTLDGS